MATIKKTAYLHWNSGERGSDYTIDGMDFSCLTNYRLIATQEVEFDIGDFDPRETEIQNLEAMVEKVRAESQATINMLLGRIGDLKAIGYEVAGDE